MAGKPPESFGGKAEVKARVKNEMLKPLVFGNHQKLFNVFTFLVSAGVTYYFVFKHDFGEERHCFTWIREYTEMKKQQFFSIEPTDTELIKMKEKLNENKRT